MITNVYIDGFNLYYGCLKGTPYKWLDISAMCSRLLPKNEIHRIRYFTAKITGRPDDPQAPARQAAYLRAIETIPELTVHLGHFRSGRARMRLADPPEQGARTVEVIKTEEKGSDVNLATALVADAFQKDARCFVVISNDSDLLNPIRLVRHDLGFAVGIINPHPAKKRSRELLSCEPTFFKQIRKGALAESQFPDQIQGAGATIRKPDNW